MKSTFVLRSTIDFAPASRGQNKVTLEIMTLSPAVELDATLVRNGWAMSANQIVEKEERKQRERDFHNKAFGGALRSELRKFYAVAVPALDRFRDIIVAEAAGKAVLEYGCGPGTYSFQLAPRARSVVGIDISDVAIEKARQRAIEHGAKNTQFYRMDAEALTFDDGTFDLVCGRAILHHLDLRRSYSTIARVLKPGGKAFFMEPLGHNPVFNLYRNHTPSLRTVDEHPLLKSDYRLALEYFERVTVTPIVLLPLATVPIHSVPGCDGLRKVLAACDNAILKLPWFRWQAWTSFWEFSSPKRRSR